MNSWILTVLGSIIFLVIFIPYRRYFGRKFERGVKLFDAENYQAAYDCFQCISKHTYAFVFGYIDIIWRYQILCLFNLSRYQEAIKICDRSLRYSSWIDREALHQIHYFKGSALAELQQYQQAIACYDLAIKYKQDNPDIWHDRGCDLLHLKLYPEVVTSCDRAIEYQPNDSQTWRLKGYALYKLGDYQEAIANCDRALQYPPEDYYADICHVRSLAFSQLGDYQGAISSCDRALQYDSNYDPAFYSKAC